MKIEELTVENVTPVIEALVAEYGEDYIYKADEREANEGVIACMYREDGKPSCLVGHILDRLGVEYNPDWEMRNAKAILKDAPERLSFALSNAQSTQDCGDSWGLALERYRNTAGV